jgi:hypothetical protein
MVQATLKQAYKTMDDVIQEIVLAEKESLEIVCNKLEEENQKMGSAVIKKVVLILKEWGSIPAIKIKEKALAL